MIKPIRGTWFEFQHPNHTEGKYWNPICRHFRAAQWEEKVAEIASLQMKYLVLMSSSLVYGDCVESYFKTDIYPAADFPCEDPVGTLLEAADQYGLKVFVSCGHYGECTNPYRNMTDPEIQARAFRAMEQLAEQYGAHPSFYGWYLPDEAGMEDGFVEHFARYINAYAAQGHRLLPDSKVLIAPYGTNLLKADDTYTAQLERIDADIIAYQDEVGVRKSTPDQTAALYEALRRVHDRAGRSALWADVELFEFEGEVYKSALLPAEIQRIQRQLESISPYVDEVLCYQYMGLMNRPGTNAFCGHPDSLKLYEDYRSLFIS
ncbi:MAG: DUF4434 domain-containing protein [Clostridiales bacterium]|nr:DUF4434 domain-containing protein [Clostridiales bacterium]